MKILFSNIVDEFHPEEYDALMRSYPKATLTIHQIGAIIPRDSRFISQLEEGFLFLEPIIIPRELSLIDFLVEKHILEYTKKIREVEEKEKVLMDLITSMISKIFTTKVEKDWWYAHRTLTVVLAVPDNIRQENTCIIKLMNTI